MSYHLWIDHTSLYLIWNWITNWFTVWSRFDAIPLSMNYTLIWYNYIWCFWQISSMVGRRPRISVEMSRNFLIGCLTVCWLMLDCPADWGKYWLWFEKNCEKTPDRFASVAGQRQWSYNEAIRGNFAIIFLSDNDVLLLLLAVNIC